VAPVLFDTVLPRLQLVLSELLPLLGIGDEVII